MICNFSKDFAIFARMIRKRRRYLLLGGILSICLLAAADILTGKAGLDHEVVLHLRLPRVLTALLAGSGLALAGTQMQSIFRNPLADIKRNERAEIRWNHWNDLKDHPLRAVDAL